jgi:hypothetical protein
MFKYKYKNLILFLSCLLFFNIIVGASSFQNVDSGWFNFNTSDRTYNTIDSGWFDFRCFDMGVPTSVSSSFDTDSQNLTIMWSKGFNATHTVIRRNTGSYPASLIQGTEIYNGTGTSFIDEDIEYKYYYSLWSYNSTFKLYTDTPVYLSELSFVTLNVFDENTGLKINNWTVFITNSTGSKTYYRESCNNSLFINSSDMVLGDDVTFYFSADDYYTRGYIRDVTSEVFVFNVYMVANDTSSQYQLIVYEPQTQYGQDPPVNNALITIQRHIIETGEYEGVMNVYTDASGQADAFLSNGASYRFIITKDGYDTESVIRTVTSDSLTLTFRLNPSTVVVTPYDSFSISLSTRMYSNNTLRVSYFDSNSSTVNWSIYVYSVYDNVRTLNDSKSGTSNSYIFYVSDVNTSRTHVVVLFYNNSAYFAPTYNGKLVRTVNPISVWTGRTRFDIDDRIENVFGEFILGWSNVISIVIAVVILVSLGPFNVGAALIGGGAGLGFTATMFGMFFTNTFNSHLVVIAVLLVFFGIIYFLTTRQGVDHL